MLAWILAVAIVPVAPCPDQREASAPDPQVAAALAAEFSRQLKPYWKPPEGAEQLVTRVRLRLAADGTLEAEPQIVSQAGVTHVSGDLAQEHADRAIAAVRQALPFRLPAQNYAIWCSVDIQFDARLNP